MSYAKNLFLGFAALTALAACEHVPDKLKPKAYVREETADRLGHAVWMYEREIPAGLFSLTAYERIHERGEVATVYIEGDGELTDNFHMDSKNPTPKNPVALHLATKDKSENLVWIARPCQYNGISACDEAYWGNERFSPEVLSAYTIALDEIKKRYDIKAFHLVGFDGGGAIASILAAQRPDVLSLRTVAANLDTNVYAKEHQMPPLTGSLNPIDFAQNLKNIPQTHFIGGQDTVVPPSILHSYLQAVGPSNCVNHKFIQEAEHTKGWVEKWPELLLEMPACDAPVEDWDFEPMPEPIRIMPETPDKK